MIAYSRLPLLISKMRSDARLSSATIGSSLRSEASYVYQLLSPLDPALDVPPSSTRVFVRWLDEASSSYGRAQRTFTSLSRDIVAIMNNAGAADLLTDDSSTVQEFLAAADVSIDANVFRAAGGLTKQIASLESSFPALTVHSDAGFSTGMARIHRAELANGLDEAFTDLAGRRIVEGVGYVENPLAFSRTDAPAATDFRVVSGSACDAYWAVNTHVAHQLPSNRVTVIPGSTLRVQLSLYRNYAADQPEVNVTVQVAGNTQWIFAVPAVVQAEYPSQKYSTSFTVVIPRGYVAPANFLTVTPAASGAGVSWSAEFMLLSMDSFAGGAPLPCIVDGGMVVGPRVLETLVGRCTGNIGGLFREETLSILARLRASATSASWAGSVRAVYSEIKTAADPDVDTITPAVNSDVFMAEWWLSVAGPWFTVSQYTREYVFNNFFSRLPIMVAALAAR
jgi:hypothetical protein